MRTPQPLPGPLRRRAFTRSQLRAWGIHTDRVRRGDIISLGAGTFASQELVSDADQALIRRLRALALAREFPHGWLSHGTAAELLGGCATPRRCQDGLVHISVPRGSPRITRDGVHCHRVLNRPDQTMAMPGIAGVRLSRPAGLWREAASVCTVEDLVALGDSLVRAPYFWAEGRMEPYTTITELRAEVANAGGFRGKRTAMAALPLIRVGSDSIKESAFRLALGRAGLPEPELQIALDPTSPSTRYGDMGYRHWRLVIQYDGGTHYTPQQHRADQHRDNDWVAAGWLTLTINVEDDREGFVTAVGQVRSALQSRGFAPH